MGRMKDMMLQEQEEALATAEQGMDWDVAELIKLHEELSHAEQQAVEEQAWAQYEQWKKENDVAYDPILGNEEGF